MKHFLFLNGPNLNRLGTRAPEIYGSDNLEEINNWLLTEAQKNNLQLTFYQSNHEGALIDQLHQAEGKMDGIIFNPGGYSHTSVALRDAVESIAVPVVEVHLSNIYARDSFRHNSLIAPKCLGQITGFGKYSYLMGMLVLLNILED